MISIAKYCVNRFYQTLLTLFNQQIDGMYNYIIYIEHKNAIKEGFASLVQCTLYFSDEKAVFQGHLALGSLKNRYTATFLLQKYTF